MGNILTTKCIIVTGIFIVCYTIVSIKYGSIITTIGFTIRHLDKLKCWYRKIRPVLKKSLELWEEKYRDEMLEQ